MREMAAVMGTMSGELNNLRTELVRVNQELNMVRQQQAQAQNASHEPRGPRREEGMLVD